MRNDGRQDWIVRAQFPSGQMITEWIRGTLGGEEQARRVFAMLNPLATIVWIAEWLELDEVPACPFSGQACNHSPECLASAPCQG